MSDEKKRKVLHVDKVVIKANEVIIEQDEGRQEGSHNDVPRDIWGFPIVPAPEVREEAAEEEHEDQHEDKTSD